MKVVLLALSGDLARWQDKLVQLYPDCSIELISRAEFENGISVAWHRVPFTLGCAGYWS